jgi:hypothetical protein
VAQKISEFPWNRVTEDVRPFLENPGEIKLLKKENILNLLKSRKA